MPRLVAALLSLALLMPAALACGDKLSAMGGGIRFERLHRAAHPARVVVYLPPRSELRRAESDLQLVQLLSRAGHEVKVVEAPEELERILASPGTDLVLAGSSDLHAATRADRDTARAALVRLDYGPAPRSAAGSGSADPCVTRISRRTGGNLVRTIDAILEPRADGQVRICR